MTEHENELMALYKNMGKVIIGKKNAVFCTIATLLCGGHLLIEDVPGVGKTILARSLAKSLDIDFKRVQCTPDLLPSDLTGVSVYHQPEGSFKFIPGPIFSHLLLVDEINRTSPRTQSALLEGMAERQVSIEGVTRKLPDPFMVIATQNPIEFSGTYPLPEAQLDRFFMRISMGYPSLDDEVTMVSAQKQRHPIESLQAVLPVTSLLELQQKTAAVAIEESVLRYATQIVRETRMHPDVALGASPRGSLALVRAAQAVALLTGKAFVLPSMIKQMAKPVLGHRLMLKRQTALGAVGADAVIEQILARLPVPVSRETAKDL